MISEKKTNMKKLESLEKRVIYPDVEFYGAYRHNGEDIYLCNDIEKDKKSKLQIECYIINNILTTNITKSYITKYGKKVKEKSTQKVELQDNELLVYVQGLGFVIPEYNMVTIQEAIDLYKIIKGDEDIESFRSSEESTKTN